jgi:fructose-bisphosphate aldolase class 1
MTKRAERLSRTNKIIKRRWKILMSWMRPLGAETKEEARKKQTMAKHRLHKYNLACGCSMCRPPKWKDRGNYKKRKLEL